LCSDFSRIVIYRFQDKIAAASEIDFRDVQFDSDREIASENEPERESDCPTASEQSYSTDSDHNDQLTDSDIDPEYAIFPISFAKADDVQSGRIPKDKILYKYLDSVTYAMIDPNHEFDEEVVQFFNSIKFLGGERTVNFVRGPMWHGCGKGGELRPE